MRVAVCSDTHVPSRAEAIPDWVRDELRAADHVVHAGDFDSPEAYREVADLSSDLTAVRGNMDPTISGVDLPETATVDLGGVRFVVTHGTGPLDGYRERVAGIVAGAGADSDLPVVGIAGHTHQVMNETVSTAGAGPADRTPAPEAVHLLNPGSATGADPATRATMMVLRVEDGEVDVQLGER